MGDTMRAAGVGPEIKVGDTVYYFKPFGPVEIGKFEAWLERKAREVVMRARASMPPDEYDRLMCNVVRDCACDLYALGSEAFSRATTTPAGLKQAALISLRAGTGNPPEVDGEFVEKLYADRREELKAALAEVGWVRLIRIGEDE